MSMTINNNLMAENVNRNLTSHYGKLGKSTQRLSSGLRVSSASDDAAGLAIRELMRADIAALNQGARNANDGISMIQTADGALGVIDAKLIRMKELAEQASTGTYTDAQRKMINQEYQLMADEITRIASDTDFNSKKLLAGTGQDVKVEQSVAQDDAARSEEAVKVDTVGHQETWRNQEVRGESAAFGGAATQNGAMDAEGVVKFGKTAAAGTATYVSRSGLATVVNTFDNVAGTGEIDTKTGEVKNLTGTALTTSTMADVAYTGTEKGKVVAEQWNAGTNKWDDVTASLTTTAANFGGSVRISVEQADGSVLRETFSEHTSNFQLSINAAGTTVTVGDGTVDSTAAIQIKSEVAASKTFEHTAKSGITVTTDAVTYYEDNSATLAGAKAELSHNARTGEISGDDLKAVESTLKNSYGTEKTPVSDFKIETYDEASNTWQEVALGANTGDTVNILDDAKKFRITAEYGDGKKVRDTISENSGGRFTITKTDHGLSIDMMTGVNAQKSSTQLKVESEDLVVVNVHFGSSSSKTDGYDTEINMATAKSLGVGQEAGDNILTQENAKKALENLTIAISKKDAIRAQIGSTQNRLSATIENISIQKENLKSAESRISDVNVATEMTEFNKQQILANAAVSMLAQANNLPKMAQKLLG